MSALFFIFEAVKTNLTYKIVKYLKKVYFRNDKRVAAYLICVAIATSFWFLNALNKIYTVDLVVPVTYNNFPDNKTLANELPDKFNLKIKAHGFSILRHKLNFFFMPLRFDVNEMTSNLMQQNKRSNYIFPTRQFQSELTNQLSNDIEIVGMNPDTLFFKFDQMGHKLVKVKPVTQIDLKKQFQISGEITSSPDSVTVNGPQATLDTLRFVTTEALNFSTVDKQIESKAKISAIKEHYFEPQWVEVNVPVEEYTEAQLSAPVKITGQPEGMTIKLFPAKVKISFQVSLSRYSEMHPEDFSPTVSYTDIQEGKQRLKVSIDSPPAFLYAIKITPEEIEYLIEN